MRQKDEEELEAEDMMETYDVDEVEADGGLPGMDQHKPPPSQSICQKKSVETLIRAMCVQLEPGGVEWSHEIERMFSPY